MTVIPTACITCGRPVAGASRCPKHRGKAWANRPKANQDRYGGDWPRIRARCSYATDIGARFRDRAAMATGSRPITSAAWPRAGTTRSR